MDRGPQNRVIKTKGPGLIKLKWILPAISADELIMWVIVGNICGHPAQKTKRLSNKSDIVSTVSTQEKFSLLNFALAGNTVLRKHKIQNFPKPVQKSTGKINLRRCTQHNPSLRIHTGPEKSKNDRHLDH
mgnify:FL=1